MITELQSPSRVAIFIGILDAWHAARTARLCLANLWQSSKMCLTFSRHRHESHVGVELEVEDDQWRVCVRSVGMPQSHPGEQDFLFATAPDTRCPEGDVGLYLFEQSRAIFMPYVCKVPGDTLAYLWEELVFVGRTRLGWLSLISSQKHLCINRWNQPWGYCTPQCGNVFRNLKL